MKAEKNAEISMVSGSHIFGFKSRLRHHKKNGGLADSSVNPLLLFGGLGQWLVNREYPIQNVTCIRE
ncbi:MAG: hypothetical protein C0410_11470, partial [Anaerolinea sp.]|nr:hypothetical protein [Anaerolinea sp.]